MLSNKHINRLNEAIDTMHQVRQVNSLIQGVCARVGASELNSHEAGGLWVVLEWQNEKLRGAEGVIGVVISGTEAAGAANS